MTRDNWSSPVTKSLPTLNLKETRLAFQRYPSLDGRSLHVQKVHLRANLPVSKMPWSTTTRLHEYQNSWKDIPGISFPTYRQRKDISSRGHIFPRAYLSDRAYLSGHVERGAYLSDGAYLSKYYGMTNHASASNHLTTRRTREKWSHNLKIWNTYPASASVCVPSSKQRQLTQRICGKFVCEWWNNIWFIVTEVLLLLLSPFGFAASTVNYPQRGGGISFGTKSSSVQSKGAEWRTGIVAFCDISHHKRLHQDVRKMQWAFCSSLSSILCGTFQMFAKCTACLCNACAIPVQLYW